MASLSVKRIVGTRGAAIVYNPAMPTQEAIETALRRYNSTLGSAIDHAMNELIAVYGLTSSDVVILKRLVVVTVRNPAGDEVAMESDLQPTSMKPTFLKFVPRM